VWALWHRYQQTLAEELPTWREPGKYVWVRFTPYTCSTSVTMIRTRNPWGAFVCLVVRLRTTDITCLSLFLVCVLRQLIINMFYSSLQSTLVTVRNTFFNTRKVYLLFIECFHRFRSILRINSDYFPEERFVFLTYFPKLKVGLSNHQSVCLSVCVSPTKNFLTAWYIFMKSGTEIIPFKGTSMQ
jgi:hypothetical protein